MYIGPSYKTYITSMDWINRCRRYFGDKPECAARGCRRKWRDGVSIHHLTYERLGRERREDLVPLCRGCHQEAHRWAEFYEREERLNDIDALRRGTDMVVPPEDRANAEERRIESRIPSLADLP